MIKFRFLDILMTLLLVLAAPVSTSISEPNINCNHTDNATCISAEEDEAVCPPDSMINPGSDDSKCICVPGRCVVPPCRFGSQRVLQRNGSNTPGDCCDIYDCVQPREKNCSEVECPRETGECPPDSYRLPNHRAPDDCCSVPQGCSCFPRPCPPANCSPEQHARIVRKGNGKPGTCCPVFECVTNGSNSSCSVDSKILESGSEWWKDDCTKCTCSNGQIFCDSTPECPELSSSCTSSVPPGQCCPVCVDDYISPLQPNGCISAAGKVLQNGESWKEDPCTTCTCLEGHRKCQAYMCEVSCVNPTYVPDECCPLCNSTSVFILPDHCPALNNCSLKCVHGFVRNDAGCYTCQCQAGECLLECPNGYAQDNHGNKLCLCADVHVACPPLTNCHKNCAHGFRTNKNGCEVCKCNQCRSLTGCNKKCVFGFRTNDRGCPICKCKVSLEQHPALISTDTEPGITCVSSVDGEVHEEGEMWFDGCRECYCHGGVEMCSLITCPTPSCDNPDFGTNSSCCPQCPGDSKSLEPTYSTMVCHSVDGVYRVEGESWQLNRCTRCLCHFGRVLCETQECPPVPCKETLTVPGECCSQCLLGSALPHLDAHGKSCGLHHPDGTSWREGACQSCACRAGSIQCYSEPCPELKCDRPLLAKNRCCPMCLDTPHVKVCTVGNNTYEDGDEWNENPCIHCVCVEGAKTCTEYVCSSTLCENLVLKEGECCPQCSEPHLTDVSETTSFSPPSLTSPSLGLFVETTYITIICVLVFVIIFMGLYIWCLCHRRKQFQKLNGVPKSCPNPAYNGYIHQTSIPPPQYHSTERHSKCDPYKYNYVPTYDMQQIEDTLKTPIEMTDKSTSEPV